MIWMFLGVTAILAIILVVILGTRNVEEDATEEPTPIPQDPPHPRTMIGLGAPLFSQRGETKSFLVGLNIGEKVWAITPHGPQEMTVDRVENGVGYLSNDNYEAECVWKENYFSYEMSRRTNRLSAWVLTRFRSKSGDDVSYGSQYQKKNQQFIRDEVHVWEEDDGLDWMIFYWFMFDGFSQPAEYYENYEVPSLGTPEEPFVYDEPVAEQPPVEEVPAEVSQDQMEEFNQEVPPADPEPTPEPERFDPPAPEPYKVPYPDPEPYSPPEDDSNRWGGGIDDGGSGYDSGSSYDSGDSGGGGFDD